MDYSRRCQELNKSPSPSLVGWLTGRISISSPSGRRLGFPNDHRLLFDLENSFTLLATPPIQLASSPLLLGLPPSLLPSLPHSPSSLLASNSLPTCDRDRAYVFSSSIHLLQVRSSIGLAERQPLIVAVNGTAFISLVAIFTASCGHFSAHSTIVAPYQQMRRQPRSQWERPACRTTEHKGSIS